MHYCDYCDLEQPGEWSHTGLISCAFCGKTLAEDNLVEEVQFSKGPGGHSRMQGAFVRSYESESASLAKSLRRGEDQINMLITSLKMDDSIEHEAMTYYKIAAERSFTRRYKIDYVAAACLYVACRASKKPYLLIDFSEKLAVNVYVLGAVFLQLCQLLLLEDTPIVQKPVDPSLFIHKFTEALVDKLAEDTVPKKEVVSKISETALNIIASMKRDWMQTGRKPSGLCGAAIYISALSNGIRFSKSEVITVVHICEATLTKRLIEFENTDSGGLTIDEFNKRAEEFKEQTNECTNKTGEAELLCTHEDDEYGQKREVHAHGLCEECYKEFFELCGGFGGGADPPSFQRPESEEVAQNVPGNMTDCSHQEHTPGKKSHKTSGQGNNITMETMPEDLVEPQFNNNHSDMFMASDDLTNDEPECLSDIDDTEVNCYLNNEEEVHYKRIIWEQMNKEYLEEQALKEAAKAASYSDMGEMTDEIRDAQQLAAAAAAAVANARKKKRQQRAMDAKNAGPPRTAAEATSDVLTKKRLGSKINFEVLNQLFDEDDGELASKKSRTDPEDGVAAEKEGVDAGYEEEEEEEADNVKGYDEMEQGYEDREEYNPDSYYNDHTNDSYYDGNDEPYNYGDDDY
uniref:Cyclin-like domain-containing protein n=1 Tax=Kalanchoe fedtschenkoi TaxID=63787 RepID=A0A7N0U8V0_KALFE